MLSFSEILVRTIYWPGRDPQINRANSLRFLQTDSSRFRFRRLSCYNLLSAAVDNGGSLGVLDVTTGVTSGLDSHDNIHRGLVSNLAENGVALVEPRSSGGGDEELGAVAVRRI